MHRGLTGLLILWGCAIGLSFIVPPMMVKKSGGMGYFFDRLEIFIQWQVGAAVVAFVTALVAMFCQGMSVKTRILGVMPLIGTVVAAIIAYLPSS